MNDDKLTPRRVGERVIALVQEIKDMPSRFYDRWIGQRANDLTAMAITIIAAMNEPDSLEFDKDALQMQAATLPLAVVYMLGRQDAARRFSRVLKAILDRIDNPEFPEDARQIDRVIETALRIYGWPESRPALGDSSEQEKRMLDELTKKGGDDLDYILHGLR